jgi:tryptophan halogenase
MGQGIEPADFNPLIEIVSLDDSRAHLAQVKEGIRAAVGRMPTHEAFIRDHRAAPVPAAA